MTATNICYNFVGFRCNLPLNSLPPKHGGCVQVLNVLVFVKDLTEGVHYIVVTSVAL